MNQTLTRPNYLLWSFAAAPFVLFAAYVAWLVVPAVVSVVVPAVVEAVTTSSN